MAESGGQQRSKLALVSLILSCIICIPPVALVGVVLGIIALLKIGKNPGLSGKGLAIAAIIVGLVGIVPGTGIAAAVAIPGFITYIRNAKIAEVETNVSRLRQSVESYHQTHGQLPPSTPLTPATPCFHSEDGRCHSPEAWNHPTWQALGFAMNEPHYYRYEIETTPTGITIRGVGNLDADSTNSLFEWSGQLGPGGQLTMNPTMTITDRTE